MTAEGEYVQVVGDHLVPLKTMKIAKAVNNAPTESNPKFLRETPPWLEARKGSPAPVVTVKKHRIAVMPRATSSTVASFDQNGAARQHSRVGLKFQLNCLRLVLFCVLSIPILRSLLLMIRLWSTPLGGEIAREQDQSQEAGLI